MRRQLKAFTLMELLVAMAITGIVVSIAGLAYNVLGKQLYDHKKTASSISSVFSLNSKLQCDIAEASAVTRNESAVIIERGTRPGVKYIFTGEGILRTENEITDTFSVAAANIKTLLMQEEREQGLIDELSFSAKVLGEQEIFHYTKRYSVDALLNKEEVNDGD